MNNQELIAFAELAIRQAYECQDDMPFGLSEEEQAEVRLFEIAVAALTADPVEDDRETVRADHAEWSQTTFGNVGPVGPLKHLAKEAEEAADIPGDLSEWADMQFLLWDAQRRAGITDEQITRAMIEKLAVNKARDWPEPKDGEPRMHIKAENDNTAQQYEALAGFDPAGGPEKTAIVHHVAPPGWQLVPVEPTEEMVAAWRKDMNQSYAGEFSEKIGEDEVVFAYQAMLEAAPKPEV
ncbi:DUF550 domain-containing protein [Mixta hanseatica]|uniref:DUF550 domain-containing protein n=1 Tax=Mixta hanseatica TaxID=2872648 RepID=A0ABY4RCH4_9GAMM|nr:DUF550 domain-containing protein [Mixta hanseatica]